MGKEWVREVLIPPTHERLEIWPIRALTSLKHFESRTSRIAPEEQWQPRRLEDLSLLRGLPLTFFVLERSPVRSLAPLSGMLLKKLNLLRTPVNDLSPLKGTSLKILNIVSTVVTTLEPLLGVPLEERSCNPSLSGEVRFIAQRVLTLRLINDKPANKVLESPKPLLPPRILSPLQEKAGQESGVSTERIRAPAR